MTTFLLLSAIASAGDLARFGDAYRNHLVAMDTKMLTDVFAKHGETRLWQTEFWGKYMHSAVPLLKRDKDKLVPFAQAGEGLYRTWMEVECHPWDGKL